MRSFGSAITALVTTGFFALTAFSAPAPRGGPGGGGGHSHGSTSTSTTSSSDASTSDTTTTTTTTTTSSDVSGGQGTAGTATIVNKCDFDAYLYVCQQTPATCDSNTTLAAGQTFTETYHSASGGGRSMKISTSWSLITGTTEDLLQFEYTPMADGEIWYDLSEVNGNPFGSWGFSLTNTSTTVFCPAPATDCPSVFTDSDNGDPYKATTADGVGAVLCGS